MGQVPDYAEFGSGKWANHREIYCLSAETAEDIILLYENRPLLLQYTIVQYANEI
jgi:hypothetical protein